MCYCKTSDSPKESSPIDYPTDDREMDLRDMGEFFNEITDGMWICKSSLRFIKLSELMITTGMCKMQRIIAGERRQDTKTYVGGCDENVNMHQVLEMP